MSFATAGGPDSPMNKVAKPAMIRQLSDPSILDDFVGEKELKGMLSMPGIQAPCRSSLGAHLCGQSLNK